MKNIAFIGIGVMGKSMARNLMDAGYDLNIYNRSKDKAVELVQKGAKWCDSVRECVSGVDAVITIIGYPKDVEEVYFGEDGVIDCVDKGTILIDMTTSSPYLAKKIYEKALKKEVFSLDAPVSGGDDGARMGKLSIMVGGDKAIFEKCKPLFEVMGKTVIYEGAAGCGQHTKMANQIAIAGAIAGVAEAIIYAKKEGLDLNLLFESISKGAAASYQLEVNGKKMIEGDFAPGFYIKHFLKDMGIAIDESDKIALKLPVLEKVFNLYQKAQNNELGELGTQAIVQQYLDEK